MRVGIDYLPAVCHAPGVGRYARELVRATVALDECPELRLFEVGGGERRFDGSALGLDGAGVRRLRSRAPRRAVTWLHRLTRIGADRLLGGVDVFHRIHADYPPVSRAPEVLPIPELPPKGSPADTTLGAAAKRAKRVVVFSEHYAGEVERRYGVLPARISATPVGCDHWVRDLGTGSAPHPSRPRVLALGALREQRYPLALLAAFEVLRSGGLDAELVVAGGPGSAAGAWHAALDRSPVAGDVRWIGAPDERDMPALVAGASTLVHLAADEGTPVTPLEAFSFGVPVAASRLPAFVEALGAEAEYVDTDDADSSARVIASAIAVALQSATDPAACDRRRAIARAHTWERCARETVRVWRAAAGTA